MVSLAEKYLGRPERLAGTEDLAQIIGDKRCLVIGAGGSIGSEVAMRLAEAGTGSLHLATNSEEHLTTIRDRVLDVADSKRVGAHLCDVRDLGSLDEVFRYARPDLVFHCAALKHVPLLESHPSEGVLTNVLGTRNVLVAARLHGNPLCVLLSTDKAVHPHGVMGATKRMAERLWLIARPRTRVARLVNVLGSSGSVLPIWLKAIEAGKPVRVTDPNMRRYFITPGEAADLVIGACADLHPLASVILPPKDSEIRIGELAEKVAQGSQIEVIGARPGEKVNEDLYYGDEKLLREVGGMRVFDAPRQEAPDLRMLDALFGAAKCRDDRATYEFLRGLVPEW